jgi:RNA polymerase sigma-70 factor (ECF subfamily)
MAQEPNQDKDFNLLRQLEEGDQEAFSLIYERYHKLLYAVAFQYLKSRAAAEDAVQHVFCKLWEHRASIAVDTNLRNYLYSMTKNYVLNYIRNQNNAAAHSYRMAQTMDACDNDLYEGLEHKEQADIFQRALARLPQQKQEVCLLKMDESLSNQDIAERMQISVNTVKTHYAQAIKQLRVYVASMLKMVVGIILWAG